MLTPSLLSSLTMHILTLTLPLLPHIISLPSHATPLSLPLPCIFCTSLLSSLTMHLLTPSPLSPYTTLFLSLTLSLFPHILSLPSHADPLSLPLPCIC